MPRYQRLIYEPVGSRADSSYNHYLDKYCKHQAEHARSAGALPTPSPSPERESLYGAAPPRPPCQGLLGLGGPTFAASSPDQKERGQDEIVRWASDQVEGAQGMPPKHTRVLRGLKGYKEEQSWANCPEPWPQQGLPSGTLETPTAIWGPVHSSP